MPPIATPAPRCRHLHTDGRQCGSPALRAQPLCFHHTALRQPLPVKTAGGRLFPQLPAPEDFAAIQRGIAEVLRLLTNDDITERRATAYLRGFANASQNLARTLREQRRQAQQSTYPVTDCVNDPTLGTIALEETPTPTQVEPDARTPIQQNQDLSPSDENFPASSETGSTPTAALSNQHPTTHNQHPATNNLPAHPQAPVQQNQDFSPSGINFSALTEYDPTPAGAPNNQHATPNNLILSPATDPRLSILEPVPVPQPRFTPQAELSPAAEIELGEMYLRLSASFRQRRLDFEAEKTAELEAQLQDELEVRIARLEAGFQVRLDQALEQALDQALAAERGVPHLHPAAA